MLGIGCYVKMLTLPLPHILNTLSAHAALRRHHGMKVRDVHSSPHRPVGRPPRGENGGFQTRFSDQLVARRQAGLAAADDDCVNAFHEALPLFALAAAVVVRRISGGGWTTAVA